MQNLTAYTCSEAHVPKAHFAPSCVTLLEDLSGRRLICSVHAALPEEAVVEIRSQPPSSSSLVQNIQIPTALPSHPAALIPLAGALLLATRSGELFAVEPAELGFTPVGEVLDDDPERSGVLAAAGSPDGNVAVLVSPVHTLLLSATHDLVAEVPHGGVAAAASVSWRGDGEFVVVALRLQDGRLSGYVLDRTGGAVKPLDVGNVQGGTSMPHVAWQTRPGGLIALVLCNADVLFFERNGLRHLRSDFRLWDGGTAPDMISWSVDSNLLAAVRGEVGEGSEVCLYARMNYKWYCRKRVQVHGEVVNVCWDEDCAEKLTLYTKKGHMLSFEFRTVPASVGLMPHGAYGLVVDGSTVLVTNFSHAVVPPPMNHGAYAFEAAVHELCFWRETGAIGALLSDGRFQKLIIQRPCDKAQVECKPREDDSSAAVSQIWELEQPSKVGTIVSPFRLPLFIAEDMIVVVDHARSVDEFGTAEGFETLRSYRLDSEGGRAFLTGEYAADGLVRAVSQSVAAKDSLVVVTSKGSISQLSVDVETGEFTDLIISESLCSDAVIAASEFKTSNGRCLTLIHESSGLLQAIELNAERALVICRDCSSFAIHEGFLSFTTTSHLLYCALLDKSISKSYQADKDDIPSILDALDGASEPIDGGYYQSSLPEGKGATRPIDRGSKIVTPIPGKVSVVLQAPRGNLETICPRPLVFEAVDRYAKSADYSEAFQLCRQQRVDMNHLVDANYNLFLENIESFVRQIAKSSYLSVFMTFLRGDKDKVNSVCDAIVQVLRETDGKGRFTHAIITGLIRREPSDHDGALDEVRKACERGEEEGSAALDFLFVLIKNEEKVYEFALGTYDLSLALFVARSSQMDPAEYSQELKQFSALEENTRKYAINMRLERYDQALLHLHACGKDRYEECVSLCHDHALYETALPLFRDDASLHKGLLLGYGKDLDSNQRFHEAAAVFTRAGEWRLAFESYRSGGLWQLAVSAARRCEAISHEEQDALLEGLADELSEGGRVREAAQVRLAHLGDTAGAVELLCAAEEWDAAFEAVGRGDGGLWALVGQGVSDGAGAVQATVSENRAKVRERRLRLEVVREAKRALERRVGEREAEEGSDVFSVSTATSLGSHLSDVTFASKTSAATSLYATVGGGVTGPMSSAKLEKAAERRKRKAARKRVRQGHPREEEALVAYLKKLVPGEFLRKRVRKVCGAMLALGRVEEVRELVREMREFVEDALLLPEDVVGSEREALEAGEWVKELACVEFL